MKKLYFLAVALIAFSANAQYEINFDNMSLGDVSPQSPYIEVWPHADATDAQVTDEQAYSGTQSMVLREQPAGSFDDIVMLLGNKASGTYTVRWKQFVPFNKTGYYNIQNSETSGTQWNFHMHFNQASANSGVAQFYDATGANQGPGTLLGTGSFTHGEWFTVKMEIDMDLLNLKVYIDESEIVDTTYTGTMLGSINFFSIDANNRYYIDDFTFADGLLSTNDIQNHTFQVYPNPVGNQLNIQSNDAVSDIAIYNVLGSLVHRSAPNAVSPSIDMSTFKSGVYFVEVTINNSRKTVKIVK